MFMNNYFEIFKRKSFHKFPDVLDGNISEEEIKNIYKVFNSFDKLYDDIKVKIKIVKADETTCNRGQEYCVEIFSEKKKGYLQNVGYLFEQLDLYLTSINIGTLWYGIAKSNEIYDGLPYTIMMGIGKVKEDEFRKDMFLAKRNDLSSMWKGEELNIANIVRFAPSACNSQPWYVENKDNKLYIYRISSSGKVGIMPKNTSSFFNQIDIGIFLCILENCLNHEKIHFSRILCEDTEEYDKRVLNAIYQINA